MIIIKIHKITMLSKNIYTQKLNSKKKKKKKRIQENKFTTFTFQKHSIYFLILTLPPSPSLSLSRGHTKRRRERRREEEEGGGEKKRKKKKNVCRLGNKRSVIQVCI